MRNGGAALTALVALAGCLQLPGTPYCPGIPTTSETFLLPVQLPKVEGWNWSYSGYPLPLSLPEGSLPPGIFLDEVHFRRDHAMVTLRGPDYRGAQVSLDYGNNIRAKGIVASEQQWFRSFAARALNASPDQVEALATDYAEVHQGGGPLSVYGVKFDGQLLDLNRLWNTTQPRFERIGIGGGYLEFGSCFGALCYVGDDVEWQFSWVHNRQSPPGGMGEAATMGGGAITMLGGPLIEGTPWGSIQVTVPGHNATGAQEASAQWAQAHGFQVPVNARVQEFDGCNSSQWPATTDPRDLNLDAPIHV